LERIMTDGFSADRAFALAMELEDTGMVFYEALAAGVASRRVRDVCSRLALAERDHYTHFQHMRQQLSTARRQAPLSPQEADFMQAIINQQVVPNPAEARRIAAAGSVAAMLELAVGMEKDSILLYEDLVEVASAEDALAIRKIIEEEKRHMQDLLTARRELR
jgi:rubrerythrin